MKKTSPLPMVLAGAFGFVSGGIALLGGCFFVAFGVGDRYCTYSFLFAEEAKRQGVNASALCQSGTDLAASLFFVDHVVPYVIFPSIACVMIAKLIQECRLRVAKPDSDAAYIK